MKKDKKQEKVEDLVEESAESKAPKAKKTKVLTKEEEDYKTQMQRIQAEFTNYRRRTEEERTGLKNFYTSNLMVKIIPILDHFDLAVKHESSDKNYALGVEMIYAQFKDFLKGEGIEEIDILNKPFDPVKAEAVGTKSEEKDDNLVLEIQMKGYQLGDKVIRKARVIVNRLE